MSRCDLLFVYGTLMSAATCRLGRGQRTRLLREGRSLGPACTAGRLYELGAYPGMTDPSAPGDRVYGEAIRLLDPARTLVWLDAYEGIAPNAQGNEYARVERPVRLASGRVQQAMVYLYCGDLAKACRIPEGRWMPDRSVWRGARG